MNAIRIKICGFTCSGEAVAAANAGIDAVGLVFARSPRQVSVDKAAEIVRSLPPFVQTVGVFVNEPAENISDILDRCSIDLAQLHGDESVSECRMLEGRVIKAFRVRSSEDIAAMPAYEDVVRGFLLDAWVPDSRGGTGSVFDWKIAEEAVRTLSRPVILAGGLTPENVAEAVRLVSPWGVDASSGVESGPGRKDIHKIRKFVAGLRSV